MAYRDRKYRYRDREPIRESQDSDSNPSPGIINIITSNKTGINTFANDGSFMEMFKKKMEEAENKGAEGSAVSVDGVSSTTAGDKFKKGEVTKRRTKILKTGIVKKKKVEDQDQEAPANDAWSRYMAEVKKYRQQACDEDGKTRPLVK